MSGQRHNDGQAAAERAFVEQAMHLIRQKLYPRISDAQFAREWQDLLLAVAEPAAYLHARGLKLPGKRYLAILREVIQGIGKTLGIGIAWHHLQAARDLIMAPRIERRNAR